MAASTRYKHGGAQPTISTAPIQKKKRSQVREPLIAPAADPFPMNRSGDAIPVGMLVGKRPNTTGFRDDASIVLNQLVGGDPTLQAFIKLLSAKRT